jgi:hypothetical protein
MLCCVIELPKIDWSFTTRKHELYVQLIGRVRLNTRGQRKHKTIDAKDSLIVNLLTAVCKRVNVLQLFVATVHVYQITND